MCGLQKWLLFTDGKPKPQAMLLLFICTAGFRVSWHLFTFRLLLRCPVFLGQVFLLTFVRKSNHILLIFQIQQNLRGFIENKMFQWALEIKHKTDLNSIWTRWQWENICKQRNDESGSLNYSNLIWAKVWRRVRRTYFNKLEQIAKGCSSFSIILYLSTKIEFYIYIHTFSFQVNQKLLGWM